MRICASIQLVDIGMYIVHSLKSNSLDPESEKAVAVMAGLSGGLCPHQVLELRGFELSRVLCNSEIYV